MKIITILLIAISISAGAQAIGILEFAYGYHYCNCMPNDTQGLKNSAVSFEGLAKASGFEVNAGPNPASEWTSFNYVLPDNEAEGIVKISDISGKLIETFVVTGKQGQRVWDTRKIKQGVYLYTFTVNGISKSGKIVIGK
jgi:hypothetical protein